MKSLQIYMLTTLIVLSYAHNSWGMMGPNHNYNPADRLQDAVNGLKQRVTALEQEVAILKNGFALPSSTETQSQVVIQRRGGSSGGGSGSSNSSSSSSGSGSSSGGATCPSDYPCKTPYSSLTGAQQSACHKKDVAYFNQHGTRQVCPPATPTAPAKPTQSTPVSNNSSTPSTTPPATPAA